MNKAGGVARSSFPVLTETKLVRPDDIIICLMLFDVIVYVKEPRQLKP